MKKENIAIIGLGYWGSIVTNSIIQMKLFKNIYVCDNDKEKINIIKKKFHQKINIVNLDQIIDDKKIKNVFLATPPKDNFSLLNILIKAKKNILIEKPGLTNLKYFKNVKNQIIKNKVKVSFGYIYIYNDYIRYLKKIINSKELGKIRYINFQRQNFGPIRDKVSVAYDLATHDISILYFLLKNKIVLKKKY